MEITAVVALFTLLIGMGWRLERKIDKTAADHRAELIALRGENQATRTELAGRIDKTVDRIDKTETRLRGEIQAMGDQIDKTETRLRGEIRAVGDKVETLENRIGHYEQRISYAEAKLNLELGATRQDSSAA